MSSDGLEEYLEALADRRDPQPLVQAHEVPTAAYLPRPQQGGGELKVELEVGRERKEAPESGIVVAGGNSTARSSSRVARRECAWLQDQALRCARANSSVYREIVPPERIVYTDAFADAEGDPVPPSHYGMSAGHPAEMLVTLTFAEHEGKTKLTARQSAPESVEERDGTQLGWIEMLDRLGDDLAEVRPGRVNS